MSDDPNAIILTEPERFPGDATRCIMEVERAELSPDVKIFMQAGGTYIWGHPKFRDNNAKIRTTATAYNRNDDGTFTPLEGTVFSGGTVAVREWFLRKGDNGTVATPEVNGKLGRYVYDRDHRDWTPREQIPITGELDNETDMGSQAGLISFLRAGQELERELYPDGNVRRVLILVDHGVGSPYGLYGICFDEYTKNILTLKELQSALVEVRDDWANPNAKPFEVVAFDACIMSAYETAVAVEDAANYMVASQESTFGKVMLGYTGLLNALSKNPAMNGKDLGKVICDACWENSLTADREFGCRSNDVFTMSVTDLSVQKMTALKTAYANFGAASLHVAEQNPDDIAHVFAKFKNAANVAEKFPTVGDSPSMVDPKNFAGNVQSDFAKLGGVGGKLVAAIDNAVVYQRRGSTLNRGGGLSAYYPLNLLGDGENIAAYQQHVAADGLSPESPAEFYGFLYNNLQDKIVDISDLADKPLAVNEKTKTVAVTLTPEELRRVESVRCQLTLLQVEQDSDGTEKLHVVYLGGDDGLKETSDGTFESTFRGKWVTLDGQPLFVQVASDATRKDSRGKKIGGSELCVSPILLNGAPYKLFFSRSYPDEKISIIGAINDADGNVTLPVSEMESLDKGDVVTPLYIHFSKTEAELETAATATSDEELQRLLEMQNVAGNPVTIGDKLTIEIGTLPDGVYGYAFHFVNPFSDDGDRDALSDDMIFFKVRDGNVVAVKTADTVEEIRALDD